MSHIRAKNGVMRLHNEDSLKPEDMYGSSQFVHWLLNLAWRGKAGSTDGPSKEI